MIVVIPCGSKGHHTAPASKLYTCSHFRANRADALWRVTIDRLHILSALVFRGRYQPRLIITDFPNVRRLDEVYTVGPITIRSVSSHHLASIKGRAWIGVIPGDRLISVSKFNRLTDWVMSRLQIQEEAVMQLVDEIEQLIKPQGLGVLVRATHSCRTTSVMRGFPRDDKAPRDEVLSVALEQGF
ncbi:putative GTP cyclohydrolase I [Paraburkholderia ribeironis]|uniref:GTP cyclohydrolase I n=1 Tax=Paraburkholderia ribeironis TaxID=1247936 RepID=A0A1N7SJE8_9BURK|nr:GTP cyclohydrolase I [Paraburkholderia ribeironis]SIT47523.1 putative GTP cyclohydrolase I [Paraburkholderia ribeironis]